MVCFAFLASKDCRGTPQAHKHFVLLILTCHEVSQAMTHPNKGGLFLLSPDQETAAAAHRSHTLPGELSMVMQPLTYGLCVKSHPSNGAFMVQSLRRNQGTVVSSWLLWNIALTISCPIHEVPRTSESHPQVAPDILLPEYT